MKAYDKASFRDFEDIPGMNAWQRAKEFNHYLDYLKNKNHLNYRLLTVSPPGPEVILEREGKGKANYVSLVSNDYLGFSTHPAVKAAALAGIGQYGTGTGASPAIGGHFSFHQDIENKIAGFFGREAALIYTTGYTGNSSTLQSLLRKQDLAIPDMNVHASVYEGCQLTNQKKFRHNDLEDLERILKQSQGSYQTRLVMVDGVYSQDGDTARLAEIVALAKKYEAFTMIDDAHGVGVLGMSGRGLAEESGVMKDLDIITGTFSKTFGHLGGYVVASAEIVRYLKYQAKQHLFSVTATPASCGILKAIDLIDDEPHWQKQLMKNAAYLREGLESLGLNTGITCSAIIPVKIGNPELTREVGRLLLDRGIYANPITYPAVALKDARIRMSVLATHTRAHLDKVLNAYEDISAKLDLKNKTVNENEKKMEP